MSKKESGDDERMTDVQEEKPEVKQAKDPSFTVEKLRANCMKLFGISTSTFDGALYGNTKETLTVNECRAVINKWLGKEN